MSGTTRARPAGPGGFEDTIKDFWASRPRRPMRGRKCAGVAAGIGYRYGVDPVVVRIALVAATIFGGIGLAFYLLGWLFLPDVRDDVSAIEALVGRGRSSVSSVFTVLLCLALIPLFGLTFGGGWFDGGGILGLVLLLAAIYVLHRHRGHYNRPSDTAESPGEPGQASFAAAAPRSGSATPWHDDDAVPPTWDPLGAAPYAWDLPEPAPEPPQEPRPQPCRAPKRRSRIGIAAFGIALVTAGVGGAMLATGTPWFSPQHVIGLVLGVLGIGMVAASFAGGSRGLIGLAVPLAAAGIVLSSVPFGDFRGGVGEISEAPRTVAELRPFYERSMGSIDLDLTQLPPSPPISTTIHNGAGSTTVLVPSTADVTYTCSSGMGDVDCLDHGISGIGNQAIRGTDPGVDGPGGQRITLDITSGMGSVEVHRG